VTTTTGARRGRPTQAQRPRGYTREQLLASATAMFAERGFESTSLEAVADGAGVTSATVYRHFRNKSDLLLAVVERAIDSVPLSERLRHVDAPSATDLSNLLAAYVDPSLAGVRKLCVEIHAVAGRNPEVDDLWLAFNRRVRHGLAAQLEAAVATGLVRADLDTDGTAALLLVVIMGLCHLDTFEPDLVGDSHFGAFLGETVQQVLTPSPRVAPPN
jgi:AcrR family transcriptional regulator